MKLLKNILQDVNELLSLGTALAVQPIIQLPQQIFLLTAELGGRFHHHGKLVVAPTAIADCGGYTLLLVKVVPVWVPSGMV